MSLPAHNQDIIVLEPMDAPMMHNHSHSGPVPVPEHEHMDASHIDIDADTVFVVKYDI